MILAGKLSIIKIKAFWPVCDETLNDWFGAPF